MRWSSVRGLAGGLLGSPRRLTEQTDRRSGVVYLGVANLKGGYTSELAVSLASFLEQRGRAAGLVAGWTRGRLTSTPPTGVPVFDERAAMEGRLATSGVFVALDLRAAELFARADLELDVALYLGTGALEQASVARLLPRASAVVFDSPQALEQAKRSDGLEIEGRWIPFPVHLTAPSPSRAGLLIYSGHLDGAPPLGARRLGEIVTALRQAVGPGPRIVIAAPSNRRLLLEAYLQADRHLAPLMVTAVDRRTQLRSLAAASRLLLLPVSMRDISLAVLDAIGAGCVVLGLDAPATRELESSGLPVERVEGPAEALAGAAARVLSSSDLDARSRTARRLVAERYVDADRVLASWLEVIDGVVRSPRERR